MNRSFASSSDQQTGWSKDKAVGLYAGCVPFVFLPGHRLSRKRFSLFFSGDRNSMRVPPLGHDSFLPDPLKFIVINH
jgi:hypothetical protein